MEMFDVVIKTPLASLGERAKPIVIIIDALDELKRGPQGDVLRLITDAFSTLPRWVKVFVTSREETTIKNQFRRFKPMELKVDESAT